MANSDFSQTFREWMDTFMHRAMRGWSQYVKSTGLSMPQFMILMQIYHRGSFAISDLSTKMEITTAAASQLVDKLVQAGFLERSENVTDRRVKQVSLTPAGTNLVQQGMNERLRWAEMLAAAMTMEQQQKVSEALKILHESMQNLVQSED